MGGAAYFDRIINRVGSFICGGYLAYSATDDSNVVTNTTDETPFDNVLQIPANTLQAGTMVRCTATVRVLSKNGADTLEVSGRFGVDVVRTGDINYAAGDTITVEFWIKTRAAPGAAVDTVGGGTITSTRGGGSVDLAATLADGTTSATNGVLNVDISARWGNAHADNQVRMDDINVEIYAA